MDATIKLEESWKAALAPEFRHGYMADLKRFLIEQRHQGRQIFPKGSEYFRALDLTPLGRVRVVILGQDPYHGEGQAHGLCFSVLPGVRIPPSLVNIYKELEVDLGIPPARHGFLESWARQGVLLLNAVLTVERGRAASHQGRGWERFTDAVIRIINDQQQPVVFMLWGSYAQKKAAFVDRSRHLVLTAPHPSPLSAHSGFFGCRHFSKANAFLTAKALDPIDWRLPDNPPLRADP
ncbi:uracil-DNA glycosylase [Sinorhizobium alkalisoli]|uniref:Uracil-DNA glycosylase n=1 Tax=Sinorhizobium alkalisoli TaxID=1752398 RepID=A0A1E3VA01_9HYPH|nr:uracil-DNA glycosylase [Sinorhizobium alkalisoli]MCA1491904.1 uracil-DNA glycosylase [Ensifer sp. NBAIM29]MCG5478711.1 uracil-DNA glycosylase [Sinorhizobium alkalisoli]ODR90453.1 uracil-DNA glycosylase [Sinorhizobium alkalisoli]QFI67752.1 Uracil-DNA glycosylase, family 1 [Sinorhizobium alkalisoli]